jgi:hypothetical protein
VFGCLTPPRHEEEDLTRALFSWIASQRKRADLSTVMMTDSPWTCSAALVKRGSQRPSGMRRVACISIVAAHHQGTASGACSTNVQLGHGQGAQALDSHLKLGRSLRGIVPL